MVVALASNSLRLFVLYDVFVIFLSFAKQGVNPVFRVLAVSSLVIIMSFSNEMFLLMHGLAVTGILLICCHYQEKKKAAEEAKIKAAEEAERKAAEKAERKAAEEARIFADRDEVRTFVPLSQQEIKEGTLLQALPGKEYITTDGVEYYKAGDTGTVKEFYTAASSGQDRFSIVWSRTGKMVTMVTGKSGWMTTFVALSQQKIKVGALLQALPGQDFINWKGDGVEYYKAGDTGTVKQFYTDASWEGAEERFSVVWSRTGKTSNYPKGTWMKAFRMDIIKEGILEKAL